MLVTLDEVLPRARRLHYAVGAFDCTEDVMIRAMLDAAEEERAPIILMALEHDLQGKGIRYVTGLVRAVADDYRIPIVLHLDHAESLEAVRRAVEHGFTSVMYDGSQLPFGQNVERSRAVVELAHAHGVSVEAELGFVAGKDIFGTDYPGAGKSLLTEPAEVVDFVAQTGVDALAVSIGTAHGVYVAKPNLDIARLRDIEAVSKAPLVMHGGSGTPEDQVRDAIRHGITKLNVYADSRVAMLRGLRRSAEAQTRDDPLPDVLFRPVREALKQLVVERLRMFGASGRAAPQPA